MHGVTSLSGVGAQGIDAPPLAFGLGDVVAARWAELRLATYNIHRWVGVDQRHDPDRIADVAVELNADLLGLQEVDARPPSLRQSLRRRLNRMQGGRAVAEPMELLARRLGGVAVVGPLLTGPLGAMRCGLISRHPIIAQRDLNLNPPGKTPRGALDVDVDVAGLKLRVIVAHLGLRRRERERQIARLMAALADHAGRPVAIMGDFNEWHAHRATLSPLDERFGPSTPLPTFPARFPILALDRIWAGGVEASLTGVRAHRSALARRASDHLPMSATARWRK